MRAIHLLPLLILAGCASTPAPIVATFACEGLGAVTLKFEQDRAVATLPGGREAILPQQISGSGYWYEGPAGQWRGKGREATWTEPGKAPVNCVEAL